MAHEQDAKRPRMSAETDSKMEEVAGGSFIAYEPTTHFPIQNIPYGVISTAAKGPRCATRIGDTVVDLAELAEAGLFEGFDASCFAESTLNTFMGLGRPAWTAARATLQRVLGTEDTTLSGNADLVARALIPLAECTMHLPARIGDYTDFYSSVEHATNVGTMFRPTEAPLKPNWKHLPVGYHGRSSSVVLSGTPVRRPNGQLQKDPQDPLQGSRYGPCRLMDFELEMAFFVGPGNAMGEPIDINVAAEQHIFGFVLQNDWSMRDIQKWEYVPLGPFTAKNIATSISAWVVTTDALEPFKCATSAGTQDPQPLPYLRDPDYRTYNIDLDVSLRVPGLEEPYHLTRSNFRYMYWTPAQQLTHHSVTGCNMQPGDLLGSGTISGTDETAYGSMLELCWKGTRPRTLPDGSERKFLKDGDNVVMTGSCQGDGYVVGFGEVSGEVLPANPIPEAWQE